MSRSTRGAVRNGTTLVILYLKTTNTVSTGVKYMKMDDVSPRTPLWRHWGQHFQIQVLASCTCDVIWCLSSSDCNWSKFPLGSVIKMMFVWVPLLLLHYQPYYASNWWLLSVVFFGHVALLVYYSCNCFLRQPASSGADTGDCEL